MPKTITIGKLLGIIGTIAGLIALWVILSQWLSNPLDANNIADVANQSANEIVNQATPEEGGIIISLAEIGGGIAVIGIILFVLFWKKIKDIRIPLQ